MFSLWNVNYRSKFNDTTIYSTLNWLYFNLCYMFNLLARWHEGFWLLIWPYKNIFTALQIYKHSRQNPHYFPVVGQLMLIVWFFLFYSTMRGFVWKRWCFRINNWLPRKMHKKAHMQYSLSNSRKYIFNIPGLNLNVLKCVCLTSGDAFKVRMCLFQWK